MVDTLLGMGLGTAVLGREASRPASMARRYLLACLIVAMNVADLVTTRALFRLGGEEVNPIAAQLIKAGVIDEVKIGLACVIAALLLVSRLRPRTMRVVWLVVFFYAAVLTSHVAQLAGVRFA